MCADVCVHDKNDGNPHAHIMLTLRPFERDGSWGAKSKKEYILDGNGERIVLKSGVFKTRKISTVDWNEQTKTEEWRSGWADLCNAYLERANEETRIDHRSYERQGIEQIPTIHLGVAASQMERKGIATERGNINREIEINKLLRQLRARINHLKGWLKEEEKNAAPPTLADVIRSILEKGEQRNRYGQIRNLKAAANVFNFLHENNITDMAGLQEKVSEMYGKQMDIGGRLNRIDRRMKTLDEHIRQAGYYQEHRELYSQYQQIKRPKRQAVFKEKNYTGIALFEAAKRYLDANLNGHALPLKSWKEERDKLYVECNMLNREYVSLKQEVKEMETIRRSVDNILRESAREMNPPQRKPRERGWER